MEHESEPLLNPNQQFYGQPPYPPQPGFANPGYPGQAPPQGYPPYPPQGGAGYPPQPGFQPGYPPQQQPGFPGGFVPPPQVPYGHVVGGGGNPGYGGTGYVDPEDPEGSKGFEFSDESIRKGFIRKVYSILMGQLLVSLGFICLFVYNQSANLFVKRNPALWIVAFVVMIVTLLAMACCEGVRRKAPTNFIFLGIFTVAQSFMLAMVSASYRSEEVVLAVGITAAVCFALTLFAFQTKWDFTVMGGVLFVAVIILLLFGIVAMFIPGKIVQLVYGSLGALIFSVYLIYDTQLMMGGKHKYSISPEEYIFAALNLYLDIINIFLYILQIIGASRD